MEPLVKFIMLREDAFPPIQATEGAACFDLCTADRVVLASSHSYTTVNTGVRAILPAGHVGLICSRSGLAAKQGVFVLNAPGIIDPDYEGELKVILARHEHNVDWPSMEADIFLPGDRIAQLLVLPLPQLTALGATIKAAKRNDGGLGSTGVS